VSPRVALFVFEWSDPETLRATLARIPPALELEEIVIMPLQGAEAALPPLAELSPERCRALRGHRLPGPAEPGGQRKAAFEYALLRGFDLVVTLRGDGSHPPERLPALIEAALAEPGALWIAARRMRHGEGGAPLSHRLAHALATGVQNRLLGLRLLDYHSGFRVHAASALRAIPFQSNSEGRAFDMEIVIQHRALGAPIRELRLPPSWREYPSSPLGLRHVLRFTAAALDYRLHQLHLTRRGHYLVDSGERYTLKSSPTGSHMQIVDAIRPGSRVLDLGCSQGLLFEVVFESTGRSRLIRALARAYHALARLWPALFAYQIILEAEIITLDDEATRAPG
jgi:hypothetical protein